MKRLFLLLSLFSSGMFYAMDKQIETFVFSSIGKREKQEDRYITKIIQHNDSHLYCTGIFDGHGGGEISQLAYDRYFIFFEEYLKQGNPIDNSLKYACAECEELTKYEEYRFCGSTLLTSCFDSNTKKMHLLWLGDSQAVVKDTCGNILITTPHRPEENDEYERIKTFDQENKITTVINHNGMLKGWIAVSRTLGDAFCKSAIPVLIADPCCIVIDMDKEIESESEVKRRCALFASDGFFDVLESDDKKKEIFSYLYDALYLSHEDFYEAYPNEYGVTQEDSQDDELRSDSDDDHEINIAQRLTYIAISHKGSSDNTTIIVQFFGDPYLSYESSSSSSQSRNEEDKKFSQLNLKDGLQSLYNLNSACANNSPEDESILPLAKTSGNSVFSEEKIGGSKSHYSNNTQATALSKTSSSSSSSEDSTAEDKVVKNVVQKKEPDGHSTTDISTEKKLNKNNAEDDTISIDDTNKIKSKKKFGIWRSLYNNYKYLIGGSACLLAIIYALYHYNYIPLNFVVA